MNSVKLNKKHLFSVLITLVLLFSLNLNTFASSSVVVNFNDCEYFAYTVSSDGNSKDLTDTIVVSDGTYNNLHYTKFHFPLGGTYLKVFSPSKDLKLYLNTNYEFDFYSEASSNYDFICALHLYNANGKYVKEYVLADGVFNKTSSSNGSYNINHHTGSFTLSCDESVSNFIIHFVFQDISGQTYSSNFFLYDMSITAVGPLYGKPITPADTSGLTSIIGDYENTVNKLPSLKDYDTDSLFNYNFDSYTSSFSFVKDMFDTFMNIFGFGSILTFALCIGLATYVIGRKVG